MKQSLLERLRRNVKIGRWDILFTLLPALIWLGGVYGRSVIMQLHCIQTPSSCSRESVFVIDKPALDMASRKADSLSFRTQSITGYLAAISPPTWLAIATLSGSMTPLGSLRAAGTDLVLTLQSIAWNGVATESARLLAQRPRPFVYSNPSVLGADPANYTSFYSGHTSFTAAAATATVLSMIRRRAPLWLTMIIFLASATLVFLTGLFRVLAGRHFTTDVLVGAVAGVLVAYFISALHTKKENS